MPPQRVLVVGASSGIGAAIVQRLRDDGAAVAGAARRAALVPCDVPLECDVSDAASCRAVVATAADRLGGIDGLVYAAGFSPLRRLEATEAADWDLLLRTNLIGAALVTAAALPHLRAATAATAIYLSSHSVPDPWPGLGAYAASKAALQTMVKAWQAEHPEIRFETFVVGPTATGFADGWEPDLAAELMPQWQASGLLDVAAVRSAEEVAAEVVSRLADRPDADARVTST